MSVSVLHTFIQILCSYIFYLYLLSINLSICKQRVNCQSVSIGYIYKYIAVACAYYFGCMIWDGCKGLIMTSLGIGSEYSHEGQKVLKVWKFWRSEQKHTISITRKNVSECQSFILSFRYSVPTFLPICTSYINMLC